MLNCCWWVQRIAVVAIAVCAIGGVCVHRTSRADDDYRVWPFNKREQQRIEFRDPASLPTVRRGPTLPPPTVMTATDDLPERMLSLDESIRIGLQNSEVVRVLAGNLAVSSGRTIYDPAVTNTLIDQQRAEFDPQLFIGNTWSQLEPPLATLDPLDPTRIIFPSLQTENYNFNVDLSQKNMTGGTARLRFGNDNTWTRPGILPLNPQNAYATELSYTQPLLRGHGRDANRVPIVLARIDTERSYFQLTDSVQELVRGVIEAYWALVFARTDSWARGIQVEQADAAYKRALSRQQQGFADIAEVSQARSALAQFRASSIAARGNLLQREAALQNILGIPPTDPMRLVPVTPPTSEKVPLDWNLTTQIAETRRPDLIELKLILEADTQRLLLAKNQAQPNVDLVALYRWNGLEGRTPGGGTGSTGGSQFTDWTLGVNFSVPLYLRQERAQVRSTELLIARDRANLEQGVHSAFHILALSFREIDQAYLQYEAFSEARDAARENLERQFAAYRVGNDVIFLNVLQAISDWGNSVSQEAQALSQYNIALANLERETGAILETHGVWMFEDRFCSVGPLWLGHKHERTYPRDIRPGPNMDRYPVSDRPAENFFNLDDYPKRGVRIPATPYDMDNGLPPLPTPATRSPADELGNGNPAIDIYSVDEIFQRE